MIATLVGPTEYARHINEVASVTTSKIRVLKRKLSIGDPYQLTEYPIRDCAKVTYQDKRSGFRIVLGVALAALICVIFYFVGIYWNRLEPGSSVPAGLLFLAFIYGLRWVFGSRIHRIAFLMRDGSRLLWKSRPGDFKYMQRAVGNVLAFAKSCGLM